MSNTILLPTKTILGRKQDERAANTPFLYMNGYNVQRVVYELIKNYMINNTPEECGVTLSQKYDVDPKKSTIHLDIAYNWKTQAIDKVPAIYVQRGDIEVQSPTMGQDVHYNIKESEDERMSINIMPVRVTCIAAAPVAVVENLVEYVKQPLISFRKEVKLDFRLRTFQLEKITSPTITTESKNNFVVDLIVKTAFDEGWAVKKDSLRIKTIGAEILNNLLPVDPCKSCG